LTKVAATATDVYNALTEQPETDCGFAARIGTLADTDVAMDELAKCLQTTEAYLRFMQQTCAEVNKSRKVRFEQTAQQMRLERERHEYKTGEKLPEPEMTYHDMMILPATTPLHELVAELGGQYAAIERCLMLAAMQKAFVQSEEAIESPRSYRPMSTGDALSEDCLQTTLVDSILLSARRGMQRAFATGHVGTASAMTNFTVDTLTEAISDVLVRRAEDLGVHRLRPGEGLLVGTANLFNNAMMIRQGTTTVKEELVKKRKVAEGIARACSVLNDLEVAAHHTTQLEQLLTTTIEKGYPPAAHEQLKMVVKSLEGVAASFKLAANSTMDSLESVLKPRIRSIVGEAVGGSEAATFMGASTVMASAADRDRMVRMNYDLDDDAYDMIQLSESYISRMCSLIDELLGQLRRYLAPRLWDTLLLMVLSTACKRLETSLKKCEFTSLGAIAMDADMRDLVNFAKENLNDATTAHKGCPALSRLQQIARLLSVDDVADVPDLIASAKRQGGWDLKNEEVKSFLGARVEFDPAKINQTLRLPKDD
jgi:conserved oligomeric Golgi complex subunit 4